MKEESIQIVKDNFEKLNGTQLMGVLRAAKILRDSSTVPFSELEASQQASLTTLVIVAQYLTDLGVLENVQILH
jgi:hypothetical protein